ncbi:MULTISPECIES: MFS transporter [unclassified Undibacterium]|uniref:MFS transporter n=1 Tax=unclassified Undibacterium TaxID=2630295 RepID=UPI002AC925BF|nr:MULTISPECIES: MFS transporter [unclassified Undibacterium]MEB0140662.1 MFS transporter [Undibacterium sp. CCC2.1]MEB0172426.1 MFS transporter [Undibacterium sp. CCC1.1]MEB0177684.1 MFS transporter [Undibacterium sp. CCC3.4]MEB0215548.1 MFS transporter [Undibacterium sp. 5I2]WPX45706.1 MFS transporter [Undibacterium sp. CCC3.4]
MPRPGNTDKEAISMSRLRAILVGSAGNLVEWFDFYCYAAFSLYFANSFFPAQDATAQMMSTAGIFALGFFIRPVGGVLFGYVGDRFGRRSALMASVLLMCFGSLLIACAPTYAMVGVWSPLLLLAARMIQGLSLGGEYGVSATYLSEMADSKHRGFYASFQYVTLIGGQLLALLLLLVLQHYFLSTEQLRAWGWRIPFVVGAGLALLALRMRHDLPETPSFEAARNRNKKMGGLRQLAQYPREVLLVIGLTMGGTLAFYVYTTYMQKFLRLSVGLSDAQTTAVSAASLIFAMCLQPLYGALSDRIGRRPLLLGFALLGTLLTVPLLSAIRHAQGPWEAFFLIACAWMIVSGYTSINALVKAEMFPVEIRTTGVGVPYAFAVSIFGGTAEYVALWFKKVELESGFYWYVTAVISCTLLVCWFMRDTANTSQINLDHVGPASR